MPSVVSKFLCLPPQSEFCCHPHSERILRGRSDVFCHRSYAAFRFHQWIFTCYLPSLYTGSRQVVNSDACIVYTYQPGQQAEAVCRRYTVVNRGLTTAYVQWERTAGRSVPDLTVDQWKSFVHASGMRSRLCELLQTYIPGVSTGIVLPLTVQYALPSLDSMVKAINLSDTDSDNDSEKHPIPVVIHPPRAADHEAGAAPMEEAKPRGPTGCELHFPGADLFWYLSCTPEQETRVRVGERRAGDSETHGAAAKYHGFSDDQ